MFILKKTFFFLNKLLLLLFLLGSAVSTWSCTSNQVSKADLENAPEAELVKTEKIMSPEERQIENKVAARTLLQKVVDESTSLKRTKRMYECTTNTGGLLTLIKKEGTIRGIRFAATYEDASEFINLYYNEGELLFVVFEEDHWQGDYHKTNQTIFYLDDEEVFRCMRKTAEGGATEIEQQASKAEFEHINNDPRLLNKIRSYEKLFLEEPSSTQLTKHFCK